jgi:DNA-binding LacI/PurR family transcriptional regulator
MKAADAQSVPDPWSPGGEGTKMSTPPRARPPGLYDVARLAGVSHQTVSRVINSHPSVREETRRRVQEAIAELGYRRNVAARTLVTRRSNIIGVITSVSPFWGPSTTLVGVERAARDAGFYLSVAGLRSIEPPAVKDVLDHFGDQGVEGIVVIAPEAALAHMAEPFITDVPVVMVAAGAEPARGVKITAIDQERGARLATGHLIELGHTRVGHIAGPEPWFDATARRKGWRLELADLGVRPGPLAAGDWTAASGHRIGLQWLARNSMPSAVFVANDLMALGFIRAMHDSGVRIPDDVSIVGFDDMPGAAHFLPGLTTVRQDLDTLGHQCIDMLVAALNQTDAQFSLVEPTLVIRESATAAQ